MKGLLLKDAYLIGKLCKSFILLGILFPAASFWADDNMFFIFFLCILSGMLPMVLISYDEQQKWDPYAGTLPYTRAQLVSAKYLIGLCGNMIVLTLIAVAQAVRMLNAGEPAFRELPALLITLFCVSLIPQAVLYPFVYRFGVVKGRVFYYFIVGAACGASMSLSRMGTGSSAQFSSFLTIAILFAGTVSLYVISWLLSIRFYRKRDL